MGCQNKQSAKNPTERTTTIPIQQTCYTSTKSRDTASLMIITSGAVVTGELRYQHYEKDSNNGTIRGKMRGDTLIADYLFNSEGKSSIREVAFLKKDGKLVEGFGEVMEKDGKVIFKSIASLKFEDTMAFTKVTCN